MLLKYFTHGFESVMPPAGSDSNKIYVTFNHTSTCTHTDVQNYFSQYGAVSEVRLSEKERHMYGHVTFLDPGTAKRVKSERGPHFICGNEVRVKAAFRKKHEQERGLHHVVVVKYAPKYFTHGFKSVMPSASSDSNKIYITFNHTSTFTHTDVQNYFSQYGAVSEVRLSEQERRMYGHVRFLDPGTAKQIISERGPHFVCGNEVRVKAFSKKHELE